MKRVLPVIVLSQLACTSVWFAVNAILPAFSRETGLNGDDIAHVSSAVQFGFISGTLLFAIIGIADRFSPSKVFFCCALLAAGLNFAILMPGLHAAAVLTLRFMTGFFLAGIYPVGMKIAADHYAARLGPSLGLLVGALVLGTSFPHLLQSFSGSIAGKNVVSITSALSLAGGTAMLLLVPNGPYRQPPQQFKPTAFLKNFTNTDFRVAATGYFGHMWELYSFWVFLPAMLTLYQQQHQEILINIPLLSFLIIASGGMACVLSGQLAARMGTKKIATIALSISGICCVLSPFFLVLAPPAVGITFLFVWGMAVIADSPLFSTMIAQNAAAASRGSALTIVNCIGFAITIISIQFTHAISHSVPPSLTYTFLAAGPATGLWALLQKP